MNPLRALLFCVGFLYNTMSIFGMPNNDTGATPTLAVTAGKRSPECDCENCTCDPCICKAKTLVSVQSTKSEQQKAGRSVGPPTLRHRLTAAEAKLATELYEKNHAKPTKAPAAPLMTKPVPLRQLAPPGLSEQRCYGPNCPQQTTTRRVFRRR